MSTYFAIVVLLFLLVGIWALLERNFQRTAGLPRAPFGADLEGDSDLARLRHDLDVSRRTS